MLASTMQLTNNTPTLTPPTTQQSAAQGRPRPNTLRVQPHTPIVCPQTRHHAATIISNPTTGRTQQQPRSTQVLLLMFHPAPIRAAHTRHRTRTPQKAVQGKSKLLRKEVIQPHLPVRLPCYDLVPITDPTFDDSLHKAWAIGFGCYRLS